MTSVKKRSIAAETSMIEQKEPLDVVILPSDINKENIAHNSVNSSPEAMDFEDECQEELLGIDPCSQDMETKSSVEEDSVADIESDASSATDEVIIVTPTKKLSPSYEIEEGELDYDDDLLKTGSQGKCDEPSGELLFEDDDDALFHPKTQLKWEMGKDNAEKLNERAKRFGITIADQSQISEDTLLTLYKSLDIPLDQVRSGKLKDIRLNAIHMRGVEQMNTLDINKYFLPYSLISVEWINKTSCNVMFTSDLVAARAMLEFSDEIISGASRTGYEVQEKENDVSFFSDSKREKLEKRSGGYGMESQRPSIVALFDEHAPPGIWRQGHSTEKGTSIFLRFATEADKKLPNEKRSFPYRKYGNSNYEGVMELSTSSRKRKYMATFKSEQFYSHDERSGQHFRRISPSPELGGGRGQSSINIELDRPQRSRRFVKQMTPSYGAQHHPPSKRRPFQECDSDSDDDENTLSAGGKKIRMRMYADAIERSWKKFIAEKKRSGSWLHPKPEVRAQIASVLSDFSSDESQEKQGIIKKNDIPSRYKIWNPIAACMAREAELAEESQHYRSGFQRSRLQNDLRSKISVPSTSQAFRYVSKSDDVDLRKKLQGMKGGSHRSPLLISFQNRRGNDNNDSSY